MYETDEVVTPLSPRLLNAAVASELVALALLVAACGWMPWNYHGDLPLARLFLSAHLLRAFGESVLLVRRLMGAPPQSPEAPPQPSPKGEGDLLAGS
jgi:hypothetical protein